MSPDLAAREAGMQTCGIFRVCNGRCRRGSLPYVVEVFPNLEAGWPKPNVHYNPLLLPSNTLPILLKRNSVPAWHGTTIPYTTENLLTLPQEGSARTLINYSSSNSFSPRSWSISISYTIWTKLYMTAISIPYKKYRKKKRGEEKLD